MSTVILGLDLAIDTDYKLLPMVDINEVDSNGDTPLHKASLKGDAKAVKILAGSGANININNNDNKTALQLAYEQGHKDVVNYLAKKAADVDPIQINKCLQQKMKKGDPSPELMHPFEYFSSSGSTILSDPVELHLTADCDVYHRTGHQSSGSSVHGSLHSLGSFHSLPSRISHYESPLFDPTAEYDIAYHHTGHQSSGSSAHGSLHSLGSYHSLPGRISRSQSLPSFEE